MRTSIIRLLGLILLLGMLPGCGPKSARTTSFGPDKVGSTVRRIDLGSEHKVFGLFPYFDPKGTGHVAPGFLQNDEIYVGYSKLYDYDEGEFYETAEFINSQQIFRGAVLFDLSSITGLSSKKIDQATLTYRLKESMIQDEKGLRLELRKSVSCARKLYTANEDWKEGLVEDGTELPKDRLVTSLPEGSPSIDGAFSVDVSREVADWVLKPKTNFGFVFVGPREDGYKDNEACASRLGDFTLKVNYTQWMS